MRRQVFPLWKSPSLNSHWEKINGIFPRTLGRLKDKITRFRSHGHCQHIGDSLIRFQVMHQNRLAGRIQIPPPPVQMHANGVNRLGDPYDDAMTAEFSRPGFLHGFPPDGLRLELTCQAKEEEEGEFHDF